MTFVPFNGHFQHSQEHSDQRWFGSISYSQIAHDFSLNHTKIKHKYFAYVHSEDKFHSFIN